MVTDHGDVIYITYILKKGPLGMGGVRWVGWAIVFEAVVVVVATSECGLFSQGFFLGPGHVHLLWDIRDIAYC